MFYDFYFLKKESRIEIQLVLSNILYEKPETKIGLCFMVKHDGR
jgi:hypothetical protein